MNFLYLGKYKKRFEPIIDQIKGLPPHSSILELCFGDIQIADFCKKSGYRWKGLDVNENFVNAAQKRGFDAVVQDLTSKENLPAADVCIMIGSLYHFHPNTSEIIAKMLTSARVVIVSEPVLNLSSQKGVIGYLARRAANAGKGHEEFRYNKLTLMDTLRQHSEALNYRIAEVLSYGKDLIVKLEKNGTN
jgi:hypothetical protein